MGPHIDTLQECVPCLCVSTEHCQLRARNSALNTGSQQNICLEPGPEVHYHCTESMVQQEHC